MKQRVTYTLETLSNHFPVGWTRKDFIEYLFELGKEGKIFLGNLAQITLSRELQGKFVGDVQDNWDIEVGDYKVELKCSYSVNKETWAPLVRLTSWAQKSGWTHLVHKLPSSFTDLIDEDKYVVFTPEDIPNLKKYATKNGDVLWSANLYQSWHTTEYRNKEKQDFIKSRIYNLAELKELFSVAPEGTILENAKMPFGRYKGVRLSSLVEVDRQYCRWLVDEVAFNQRSGSWERFPETTWTALEKVLSY